MTSMIERWMQDPGEFLPVSEHDIEDGAAPDHALAADAPPDIDGDTQTAILTDILSGIRPDQSWLTYTPEMLAYRADLEAEIGAMRAEYADAIVDVPADIPSLDVSAERGVARATLPKRNEKAVNALLRPQTGEGPDLGTGRRQVPAGAADAKPTGQPEVITFGPGKTQLGAPGDEVDEANKPVDWYVDIGFPPLEQKDVSTYMDAMVKLAMLLPQGVEGKKLVIGLALSVMGVNDVDQVMDLLVTELQKQEKEQKALMAGGGQGGFGAGRLPPGPQFLTPGGGGGFGGGGGGFGQPRGGGRFGEADELPLPEARMQRIIEAVGEAAAALEQVSEHGDKSDPDYAADFHPGHGASEEESDYMRAQRERLERTRRIGREFVGLKDPWTVWTSKQSWTFATKSEAVAKFNELRAAGETPSLAEPKVKRE